MCKIIMTTVSTGGCIKGNSAVIDIPHRVCYNTYRQRARCTLYPQGENHYVESWKPYPRIAEKEQRDTGTTGNRAESVSPSGQQMGDERGLP